MDIGNVYASAGDNKTDSVVERADKLEHYM